LYSAKAQKRIRASNITLADLKVGNREKAEN